MFSTSMIASSTTAPSDHQARQGHRVDGRAAPVEHEHGGYQRQRDRQQTDQRHAPLEQEQRQDDHDQYEAEHQCLGQVGNGHLDEVRLLEHLGVEVDPCHPRLEFLDSPLDFVRHLQGVCPRQLLDYQHQPGTAADDRVADQRLVPLGHRRDVPQPHGLARLAGDRGLRKVLGSHYGQDIPDADPLVRRFDEA